MVNSVKEIRMNFLNEFLNHANVDFFFTHPVTGLIIFIL